MTIVLPDYTITEQVSETSSSIVLRGYRNSDAVKVVIKSHRSNFPTAIDRARVRHEHAVLSELQGPGIVPVHPLLAVGNRVALVMEDTGHASLDNMLSGRLDVGLTLRILQAACAVLDRAHRLKIVHRDIKPHNLLVGLNPLDVHVIDWGIASRLTDWSSGRGPESREHAGTAAYLAPEQTGLIGRTIDARTDLYALGITAYQLLTGLLPFQGDEADKLFMDHLNTVPPRPHEVNPAIPIQVSDLVMKLIEKSPDDRFESAYGLKRDLVECLSQWEQTGQIELFPLGRYDRPSELRISQKLYGRERELAAILGSMKQVQQGVAQMLLVTGPAGVGKSALVHESYTAIRLAGARLVEGKFEQFHGSVPHAVLARMFRELVRQVLGERGDIRRHWRERLDAALGWNAGVLAGLVPEITQVLGEVPPVAELRPVEAESRLHRVIKLFLSTLASAERPLVLFFDDLQWADAASLKLLRAILLDVETHHILVIGSYRDHGIDLGPLTRVLEEIADAGRVISRIELAPFAPANLMEMLVDTLGLPRERVEALGAELYGKAQGNSFLIHQLLTFWAREGLFTFDEDHGAWTWDLPAMVQSAFPETVADFMAQRLGRLEPAALELLKLGACLGSQFEHDVLAELAGRSIGDRAHEGAIAERLVVPVHGDSWLLREVDDAEPERSDAPSARTSNRSDVSYRFLHERIKEACYVLLSGEERARVHMRIARLLHARHAAGAPDAALFALAEHWVKARSLVIHHADRLAAAEIALRAGRLVRASGACFAARDFLRAGVDYLPEVAWDGSDELSLCLRSEHAEAMFFCGDFEASEAIFDELFDATTTPMLRVRIDLMRLRLLADVMRWEDAVVVGRRALAGLEMQLPATA